MSSHTPGPWYTAKTGNHQGLIISEQTGENIAVTYAAENAQIVAAAPAMLEALQEIFEHAYDDDTDTVTILDDFDGMREIARQAIEKATGQEIPL